MCWKQNLVSSSREMFVGYLWNSFVTKSPRRVDRAESSIMSRYLCRTRQNIPTTPVASGKTDGHGRLWPNRLWPNRLWPIFSPTLDPTLWDPPFGTPSPLPTPFGAIFILGLASTPLLAVLVLLVLLCVVGDCGCCGCCWFGSLTTLRQTTGRWTPPPPDHPPPDRPKCRSFFPLLPPFSFFLCLSGCLLVECWWCLKWWGPEMCTFGLSGCRVKPRRPVPSKTPPKFHKKTPREGRKEEICGGRGEKSAKFLAPHPSGPHPSGPHPSGRHPSGPHFSRFGPAPFGAPPFGAPPFGAPPFGAHPSEPHPSAPHPSGPTLRSPQKTETPIWAKVGLAKLG